MPQEKSPRFMKQKWWPQPHDIDGSCTFEVDNGSIDTTIVPLAFYDEGLGAPSAIETNPENAAFAIINDQANCFVGSRINMINAKFTIALTSKFFDDNLPAISIATMPIFLAFINDYTAIDELTSLEIQDILEFQTESTDRQGGPLYVAAADMVEKATGLGNLGANTPFLDTDVGIEGVAFSEENYYDMLAHTTLSEKLKSVQGGLKWEVLTANRPVIKKRFFIRPRTKAMNPFTYFGVMLHVPEQGDVNQIGVLTRDYTAATQYVDVDWHIRYNEWNPEFNMAKV